MDWLAAHWEAVGILFMLFLIILELQALGRMLGRLVRDIGYLADQTRTAVRDDGHLSRDL